jgi:hypothetical protein
MRMRDGSGPGVQLSAVAEIVARLQAESKVLVISTETGVRGDVH